MQRGCVVKHILFIDGRDEATRTPDPYVPNVVRYQLRYIPIAFASSCKGSYFFGISAMFYPLFILT